MVAFATAFAPAFVATPAAILSAPCSITSSLTSLPKIFEAFSIQNLIPLIILPIGVFSITLVATDVVFVVIAVVSLSALPSALTVPVTAFSICGIAFVTSLLPASDSINFSAPFLIASPALLPTNLAPALKILFPALRPKFIILCFLLKVLPPITPCVNKPLANLVPKYCSLYSLSEYFLSLCPRKALSKPSAVFTEFLKPLPILCKIFPPLGSSKELMKFIAPIPANRNSCY